MDNKALDYSSAFLFSNIYTSAAAAGVEELRRRGIWVLRRAGYWYNFTVNIWYGNIW